MLGPSVAPVNENMLFYVPKVLLINRISVMKRKENLMRHYSCKHQTDSLALSVGCNPQFHTEFDQMHF